MNDRLQTIRDMLALRVLGTDTPRYGYLDRKDAEFLLAEIDRLKGAVAEPNWRGDELRQRDAAG